jgi:hypothetical protein
MGTSRWWDLNDPEEEEAFGRAVSATVRNWMANKIKSRAGLDSRMTGRAAIVHVAGNMNAPGAIKCFREVASKLGPSNTVEALVLHERFRHLFPEGAVANARQRLDYFGDQQQP